MAESIPHEPIEWRHLQNLLYEPYIPSQDDAERDVGFEQIGIIEKKLAYLEERLKNKTSKSTKLMKARRQREELQGELAQLKAGHAKGAKVLREKAQSLALLPREMRNAIFEQMYVQQDPIPVTWSRFGPYRVFHMPKDTALYMSLLHVGADLAREASEIFYKRNTFAFVLGIPQYVGSGGTSHWAQIQLHDWFSTDHYRSGVKPKDLLRKLDIRLDRLSYHYHGTVRSGWGFDMPDKIHNHITIEELSRSVEQDTWKDHRRLLLSLKKYDTLQHMRISTVESGGQFDCTARLLNPAMRALSAAGVRIDFVVRTNDTILNISSLLDDPSDTDFAEYYQVSKRDSVFGDEPSRDTFDTWQIIDSGRHDSSASVDEMLDNYSPSGVPFGFMRVWLFEHYEMHKFLERECEVYQTVVEMAQKIRLLSDDERASRRRFYPRLLEHYR